MADCHDMPKQPPSGPATPSVVLARFKPGGDVSLPAFRPLRELATVTDEDELRREMLARLDDIYDRAIGRQRTVGKDQSVVKDPDSHSACKVVEIASDILGVKVPQKRGGAFDPKIFEQPAKEAS